MTTLHIPPVPANLGQRVSGNRNGRIKKELFDLTPDDITSRIVIDQQGCWRWVGLMRAKLDSYGVFWVAGKAMRAHRISWIIFRGAIPENMCVCHTCDVPSCVNPDHLFLGTANDNMKDMYRKGRHKVVRLKGEKHPRAKLAATQVVAIRQLASEGIKPKDIAAMYGVAQATICAIRRNKTWRDVLSADCVEAEK